MQVARASDPTHPHDAAQVLGPGPWLVIAPHDDDALIGLGAAMHAATRAGIAVHVAVITDGRMGWDDPADRAALVATRAAELDRGCAAVGVPVERIHRLGFPDGSLNLHGGCRDDAEGGGIGRRLTAVLRRVRPGAVFVCTGADLHPDHQITSNETSMALAWASGAIWRELGAPIAAPRLWHYAVYCAFPRDPDVQIRCETQDLGAKIASLECFVSQPFIHDMVDRLRADGPLEYLMEETWTPYRPAAYAARFGGTSATSDAVLRDDARQVLDGLDAWKPWPALEEALREPAGIRLVGEGSSRLFVAGFARSLLRRFGSKIPFDACGGRSAEGAAAGPTQVLVSNSGATREIVEAVGATKAPRRLALLGLGNGPVARLADETRVVLQRPETAVAATASVFLQAFTLGAAIARVHGQEVPVQALRAAVAGLIDADLPEALRSAVGGARRLWWCDAETGLADELALKTMELCGLPGLAAPGTMALHGLEEVFTPDDRVLWLSADRRDESLRAKVGETTRAAQIVLDRVLPLADVGPWTDLLRLVLGWRILGDLAVSLGRDPARPQRARKVGNPLPTE